MKTALVLSGGGARGAYEAGIVTFLREELEPRLGKPLQLDILCGTSVGALTACALAASAARPHAQGGELRDLWASLSLTQVLRFGPSDLARAVWEMGGGGLANPSGMRAVLSQVKWRDIGRNLRAGRLEALSVCATRVSNGRTAVFVQQRPEAQRRWFENPHFDMVRTRISPRHALASAAMPVLFAPVPIRGQLYLDGGLRMNVPLSPALHLGAQRVAVVSLQREERFTAANRSTEPVRPSAAFLAGKAMNALLQDRLEQDVQNLRRINSLIEAGRESFGPEFARTMNVALATHRTAPMRYVRNLLLRPSRDLGDIASKVLRSPEFLRRHPQARVLLTMLGGSSSTQSADLASYLLFDSGYAEELIALGRADARSREDDWARFFDDTPCCDAEAEELARPGFVTAMELVAHSPPGTT